MYDDEFIFSPNIIAFFLCIVALILFSFFEYVTFNLHIHVFFLVFLFHLAFFNVQKNNNFIYVFYGFWVDIVTQTWLGWHALIFILLYFCKLCYQKPINNWQLKEYIVVTFIIDFLYECLLSYQINLPLYSIASLLGQLSDILFFIALTFIFRIQLSSSSL